MERCVELLLHLKFLLSELLCHIKGTQFYWWRISNEGDDGVFPLSILVFGREPIADDVVAAFFSNRGFTKTQLEQCPPFKAARIMDTHRDPGDAIVMMETPWWRRSAEEGDAVFQTLVDTRLEINGRTFEQIVAEEMGKHTRKKILRSVDTGHCIRQTRDIEEILSFCRDLLAPSAKAVHGDQANVPSEEVLRALADKLFLLVVEEDGKPIAGELSIYSKRTNNLRMYRLGISEELLSNSSLKSQYHMAFYAHHLKLACEMKLSSVSFGLTSPVMTHGNLIYKLRLGCKPFLNPNYPRCVIKFSTRHLPELLDIHPLLVIADNDMVGLMSVDRHVSPDTVVKHLNAFFKGFTYRGLETINCIVHSNWYDGLGGDVLQNAKLNVYELGHVKRRGEYAELTFDRRPGA